METELLHFLGYLVQIFKSSPSSISAKDSDIALWKLIRGGEGIIFLQCHGSV